MHIFVYSKNGHAGVLPYLNPCGGYLSSTDEDADGGTLSVFVEGCSSDVATLGSDPSLIVLSHLEFDETLTDDMVAHLSKHPKHGITKGDTLRQALKKVRAARNGDPHFLPH